MIVIVIPARLASSRLPAKLLLDLGGMSILERSFKQACKSKLASKVLIACDDKRLYDHAKGFTDNVFMTSAEHQSGTDRIAELTLKNPEWQIIINVQGDEPFINPDDIDKAIEPFKYDPLVQMTSLYHEITEKEALNSNNVKLVTDINENALYFSRSPIPFYRDSNTEKIYKKHIGLYAYRRETLLQISRSPISSLEKAERLEQLRALENGITIKMIKVNNASIGIDSEEDLIEARKGL
jgi:3-deoxy-manno-octulosonate cytidylyltransferase (CMP-KDO synthetase)